MEYALENLIKTTQSKQLITVMSQKGGNVINKISRFTF